MRLDYILLKKPLFLQGIFEVLQGAVCSIDSLSIYEKERRIVAIVWFSIGSYS